MVGHGDEHKFRIRDRMHKTSELLIALSSGRCVPAVSTIEANIDYFLRIYVFRNKC